MKHPVALFGSVFTVVLFGVPPLFSADNATALQAGVGRRTITPKKLLPISGGVGIPQPAKETRGEIDAQALVLQRDKTTLAIVSLDLLFGLTNDAFGYILTKVDFNSFPRYDYVSRTSLGEMTGEILIEKSLNFVKKNPTPEKLH